MALRWAVEINNGSTYIRLVSIPCEIPYDLPKNYKLKPGRGVEIIKGRDAAIIAYGPVMLTEAVKAAQELSNKGVLLAVINLPWLNHVDKKWLANLRKYKTIITVDDHYVELGQGTLIASLVAKIGLDLKVVSFGITSIPECGQNTEVLSRHRLDYLSLVKRIKASL